MRIGNFEVPGGLLVIPAFVLAIALLLLWSWYDQSKQKGEMQRLAVSRGWKFLGKDAPELRRGLEELDTDADRKRGWSPWNIILVEGPPDEVYLFNYQIRVSGGRGGNSEFGTACLAERPGGTVRELVMIYGRSPLFDDLENAALDDLVEVGGPEFRRQFRVRSHRRDTAAATVTSAMQEVLLRPASGLTWDRVWIVRGHVLVTAALRLKPDEWDKLLGMTKRLRAALP